MTPLEAWGSIRDGWRRLWDRAGEAMTRFRPARRGELETADDQALAYSPGWGLLTADIRENDDRLQVRLEVPGMKPDDFDIDVVDGNVLVVRGEKRAESSGNRGRYHVVECAYGRFERAVRLPAAVDESGARARYRRGVLSVELPKAGPGRRRRVEVKPG
ncbi:MAG TPA: Hsp20/alpha crystallin family protein [Gammaproteobacteria bacterium]|nr:Hsp20/alpha crystallin family protein [Gammaproteobacteria bacterium]